MVNAISLNTVAYTTTIMSLYQGNSLFSVTSKPNI